MLTKSASEECGGCLRERLIAIRPLPAIDGIQVRRRASHDAGGHSTTNDFAIRDKIRAHVEPCLRTARMQAKACDHLVEDKRDTMLTRQRSQGLQERPWLHVRTPTLHRFDEHGRE